MSHSHTCTHMQTPVHTHTYTCTHTHTHTQAHTHTHTHTHMDTDTDKHKHKRVNTHATELSKWQNVPWLMWGFPFTVAANQFVKVDKQLSLCLDCQESHPTSGVQGGACLPSILRWLQCYIWSHNHHKVSWSISKSVWDQRSFAWTIFLSY